MYNILTEAPKTIASWALDSDYAVGKYWTNKDTKDQHIFEVVGVNGKNLLVKEVKVEKKGRYNVPMKGKYLRPNNILTAKDYLGNATVYDQETNSYYELYPMRLDGILDAKPTNERFPAWKVGAIVHVSWGTTMLRNDFYEIVARSGITVTLRHRNHKILTQDKNDSGTETLADGFSTTKTIRARIVSSGRADGVVKLDYGMFGYRWDGKPVSFYGD